MPRSTLSLDYIDEDLPTLMRIHEEVANSWCKISYSYPRGTMPMLQKILLAIGDSPDSAQILASGLTLAEKLDAEILILHVLDPLVPHGLSALEGPLIGGVLPIMNDLAIDQYVQAWNEYERKGIDRLQSYAKQAKERGVKADILQNYGGRNQKSLLNEIFLGSTSNYVLHHAHCSVMVIQLPAQSS
jgi:nucleotide-binding universal stress UspA family protein